MRAFAIRFVAAALLCSALQPVLVVAHGNGWMPWPWMAAFIVMIAAVFAVAGHVGDYRRWEGRSFGGSDDRPWREILFGSREDRLRESRKRVFRNSASAGFVAYGLAFFWVVAGWSSDTRSPLQYVAAAAFVWIGSRQIWTGWRRWRAGGEFNYPPRDEAPGSS